MGHNPLSPFNPLPELLTAIRFSQPLWSLLQSIGQMVRLDVLLFELDARHFDVDVDAIEKQTSRVLPAPGSPTINVLHFSLA